MLAQAFPPPPPQVAAASGSSSNHMRTDAAFAFVRHMGHHFVAQVAKTTPSGRQQSAVFVIFSDCVCLLTNRGGLHRYVPLRQVVGVTVFPRARLCIHVAQAHDLLITCTQQPKLLTVLQSLFVGLTGSKLTVHVDENAPTLDRLTLRPTTEWKAEVPGYFLQALKEASLAAALESASAAEMVLANPLQPTRAATATSALPSAPYANGTQQQTATSLLSGGETTSTATASVPDGASAATAVGHVMAPPSRILLGPRSDSPLPDASHDVQRKLCLLVIETDLSTITVPSPTSLWEYLKAASQLMPGASSEPTVSVSCLSGDSNHGALKMNSALMHQTMTVFATAQPHMVTLQRRTHGGIDGEGHHFDGSIFWASLAETAGGTALDTQLNSSLPF